VLVQTVQAGGPAAKAGIKGGDTQVTIDGNDVLLGGDVIQAVDGKAVSTVSDVVGAVNAHKPGQTLTLTILRSGRAKRVGVKLGSRPSSAPQSP
jgi:S1-C subfamily serine protease